jgi:hypothetical protein
MSEIPVGVKGDVLLEKDDDSLGVIPKEHSLSSAAASPPSLGGSTDHTSSAAPLVRLHDRSSGNPDDGLPLHRVEAEEDQLALRRVAADEVKASEEKPVVKVEEEAPPPPSPLDQKINEALTKEESFSEQKLPPVTASGSQIGRIVRGLTLEIQNVFNGPRKSGSRNPDDDLEEEDEHDDNGDENEAEGQFELNPDVALKLEKAKPVVISVDTPAGKMFATYDMKDDVYEFLPAENPALVVRSTEYQERSSTQSQIGETQAAALPADIGQFHTRIHTYPVHGQIQFKCSYLLDSDRVRKFIDTYYFVGLLAAHTIVYMILVEYLRLPTKHGWAVGVPILLSDVVVSSLFVFEIERHLLKMLLRQFNFWFLVIYISMFSISFFYLADVSVAQKVTQFITVFVVHILVIMCDAVPRLPIKLKIGALLLLMAYGLWTLIRGAYEVEKFLTGYQWCWTFCGDVPKLRLAAYSNVFIFYGKFAFQLIRHPANKIILSSAVNYKYQTKHGLTGGGSLKRFDADTRSTTFKRTSLFLASKILRPTGFTVTGINSRPNTATGTHTVDKVHDDLDMKKGEPEPFSGSKLSIIPQDESVIVDAKTSRPLAKTIPFANLVKGDDRKYHIRPWFPFKSFVYNPLVSSKWLHDFMLRPFPVMIAAAAGFLLVILLIFDLSQSPFSLFLSLTVISVTVLYTIQVDRTSMMLLFREFDFYFMFYNMFCAVIFGILDNKSSGSSVLYNIWRMTSGYSVFLACNSLAFMIDGIPECPRWVRVILWFIVSADHMRVLLTERFWRKYPINGLYCVLYCAEPIKLANLSQTNMMLFCLKSSLNIVRFPNRYSIIKAPMTTSLIVKKGKHGNPPTAAPTPTADQAPPRPTCDDDARRNSISSMIGSTNPGYGRKNQATIAPPNLAPSESSPNRPKPSLFKQREQESVPM